MSDEMKSVFILYWLLFIAQCQGSTDYEAGGRER